MYALLLLLMPDFIPRSEHMSLRSVLAVRIYFRLALTSLKSSSSALHECVPRLSRTIRITYSRAKSFGCGVCGRGSGRWMMG